MQEREEAGAKNEREGERKLRERTSRVDIALESARRVYAIFTLDLIFWRRPSLVRDRYMSHGHTRAARIKTSKRSQREFLTPSLLASLLPSSASSFSILVAPSSRLPPYLVYPSFLPTVSLRPLLFRLLLHRVQDGLQEDEESKGLAHNRFSLSPVIALTYSLMTNRRLNNMLT